MKYSPVSIFIVTSFYNVRCESSCSTSSSTASTGTTTIGKESILAGYASKRTTNTPIASKSNYPSADQSDENASETKREDDEESQANATSAQIGKRGKFETHPNESVPDDIDLDLNFRDFATSGFKQLM